MMFNLSGKTYWLIGASEGLGRALAYELSASGVYLCLSARNETRLTELASKLPGKAMIIPMDVRNSESVAIAFEKLPKLDGIIYSAGTYEPMAADEWDSEAAEVMLDVNIMGAMRSLGHAIPAMNQTGGGHIILIGSLSGLKGLPGSIGYSSSKAALIHLAECLRADLDPKKFKIQIINPGFIKSRLTDKNTFPMPFIMSANEAARRTLRIIRGGRFRTAFPKRFAFLFYIANILPDWIYFKLFRKTHKSPQ
ncbi:MAG: SDR family NAD(P)-dependent oxidoreductase [Rhodospirillales bacterium]|jgi:short-subunit dehydrogenase